MTNLLKTLPQEIERLIYSYDDTYKPQRNALWNPIFTYIVRWEKYKYRKEEFSTYEREEWLYYLKFCYNKVHYFDTMKKQKEENLKVGDVLE